MAWQSPQRRGSLTQFTVADVAQPTAHHHHHHGSSSSLCQSLTTRSCSALASSATPLDSGSRSDNKYSNAFPNIEQLASTTPGDALFTQVISDVDDTLKSSGGVNIAGVALGGIDVQYPRGEFYPGVAEFMLQVSLGNNNKRNRDIDNAESDRNSAGMSNATPPKVAILTARAEEFKLALELKEDSSLAVAFRRAGQNMGISGWGLGPVLYGSVAEWIVQYRKGLRKFTNFERLLEQDPSGQIINYVYVGDTGELDQEAGETMLREYPTFVKAVFLHCVSGSPGGNVAVPPPKFINGRPLVFFRTYVGAALAAVQLQLMSSQGLRRVIEAACDKLQDEPRDSDKWSDLLQDIERAKVVLKRF